ncbi:Disease resistance protein RGA2 [Rhynchospora pubera]|uniref:Disease resistance protein RGA2 n=1 Tax=Rhynchospora pubera TaxID=906938 RepID=A0AAV8D1C3_9POAL|nr:Disease resistance protein RGA2 [Rhynchospora pubera]
MVTAVVDVSIAGWFASSTISKLIDKGRSYCKGQKSWQSELDRLARYQPQIQTLIYKAERSHLPRDPNHPLYKWLGQLQDAVEDADNLLDEFEYRHLKKEKKILKFALRAAPHDDLLRRLREVVKTFNDIATGLDTFAQVLTWLDQRFVAEVKGDASQETGFLCTENKFFGREEETQILMDWLTSSDTNKISVFSIVGVGGVGKTVLAQHLFDHEKLRCFRNKMWVCVSHTFDEMAIAKKILKLLTEKELEVHTIGEAQRALMETLSTKKFFLVLDNVWNDKERERWENLMKILRHGGQGSKILLTTRMESVANIIVEVVGEPKMSLNLNGLGERESMVLFEKYAFIGYDPKDYPKLQSIGNEIVKKLRGIPLAVKTIGGMLNDKPHDEFWSSVLENGALNSDKETDGIMEAIRLSYEHLPPEVKPCFRYCSLFPQHHEFNREQLVDIWISVGIVSENDGRGKDVANNFFDTLLRKSFFEPKDSYYTMHDLLHELAQFLSKNECLCVVSNDSIQIEQSIRHLSLRTSNILVLKNLSEHKYLRTLLLYCDIEDSELGDVICAALRGFKTVRYLELSAKHLRVFPKSIGKLIHLRILSINSTEISKLSSCVCKLYQLQILEFTSSDCSKGSIPSNLCQLLKLKRLYLPSNAITMVPHIGKLTSLQVLNGYSVKGKTGYDINELEMMSELRELLITNLENVNSPKNASKANLTSKKHLLRIALRWSHGFENIGDKNESDKEVVDCLQPHSNLTDLFLDGYRSTYPPNWLEAMIVPNLTEIQFSYCSSLERLPPLGQLPCLKCLILENMGALKKIDLEFYGASHSGCPFPLLETLELIHLIHLEEWIEDPHCEKWFPLLKRLVVVGSPSLKKLPSVPTSLKELELNSLEITTLPEFKQQNEGSSTNQGPMFLSSLLIIYCSKLTSLRSGLFSHPDKLTSLEELAIWNCAELVQLPSKGFRGLTNLKTIRIEGCMKLILLPMLLPKNFFPPSVQQVMMSSCGDLVASLPQLLPDLSLLSLLKLENCSNLMSLPAECVLWCLKSLTEVQLRNCQRLKSLGGLGAISSLKILVIKTCPMLAIEPQVDSIEESPKNRLSMALDKLDIDQAEHLFVVPLRNLYFTKSVEIRGFSSMTTFPDQWLQQNAASLHTLGLYGLNSVESFPDSLQSLTSLKMLVLHNAFRLARLPELPESLEILDIDGCNEELAGTLKDGGLDFDKVRDLDVGIFGVLTESLINQWFS